MFETFTADTAPGFAKHASSFRSDDRCEDVYYVVGEDFKEVLTETLRLYTLEKHIDYDLSYSTEAAKWVGITTRDKE